MSKSPCYAERVQLNVRVGEALREKLNAYAKERGISLNAATAWLLAKALSQF